MNTHNGWSGSPIKKVEWWAAENQKNNPWTCKICGSSMGLGSGDVLLGTRTYEDVCNNPNCTSHNIESNTQSLWAHQLKTWGLGCLIIFVLYLTCMIMDDKGAFDYDVTPSKSFEERQADKKQKKAEEWREGVLKELNK